MGKASKIAEKTGIDFSRRKAVNSIVKSEKAKKKASPKAINAPYAQTINKNAEQKRSSKPSLYLSPLISQIFAPVFKIKQDNIIIAEKASFK